MKTLFTKKNFYLIPEIYFIVITLFYWLDIPLSFNPFAIIIIGISGYLIISKNKIIGIIFSSILLLLSLYMALAFLSDFHKITTFDAKATKFVLYGSLLIGFSILMSVLLIIKNANLIEHNNSKVTQLNN